MIAAIDFASGLFLTISFDVIPAKAGIQHATKFKGSDLKSTLALMLVPCNCLSRYHLDIAVRCLIIRQQTESVR
jgi:hypothetical protein